MSHQDSYYRENEAYAEHLAAWEPALYSKYARALDVGCGVKESFSPDHDAIVASNPPGMFFSTT